MVLEGARAEVETTGGAPQRALGFVAEHRRPPRHVVLHALPREEVAAGLVGPRHHLGLAEVRLVEAEVLEDGHGQGGVVAGAAGRCHQLVLRVAHLDVRQSRPFAALVLQLQIRQGAAAVLLARLRHHRGGVDHNNIKVLAANVADLLHHAGVLEKRIAEAEGVCHLVRHGARSELIVARRNVRRRDVHDAHSRLVVGEHLAGRGPRQHPRLARHRRHVEHEVGVADALREVRRRHLEVATGLPRHAGHLPAALHLPHLQPLRVQLHRLRDEGLDEDVALLVREDVVGGAGDHRTGVVVDLLPDASAVVGGVGEVLGGDDDAQLTPAVGAHDAASGFESSVRQAERRHSARGRALARHGTQNAGLHLVVDAVVLGRTGVRHRRCAADSHRDCNAGSGEAHQARGDTAAPVRAAAVEGHGCASARAPGPLGVVARVRACAGWGCGCEGEGGGRRCTLGDLARKVGEEGGGGEGRAERVTGEGDGHVSVRWRTAGAPERGVGVPLEGTASAVVVVPMTCSWRGRGRLSTCRAVHRRHNATRLATEGENRRQRTEIYAHRARGHAGSWMGDRRTSVRTRATVPA
ncbi:hypothetical protein GH5_06913 [Leishmania sp. Ghana 2012 LV757]|uniref:hypothetical protein n=1 Tax=Leishmania sp. Ghana 2012 LV757 TaxID=2803181 RepID=UPI001B6D4408|nr:hypothetical protein GH5_06913 [Leishmania sp. Ghana 2012 LV757]